MNPAMRIAGAAVLAAVAVVGSLYLLGGNAGRFGGQPTPSPTATVAPSVAPTEAATAPIDTLSWDRYPSGYGVIILYPPDWTTRPSTHEWTLEGDAAFDSTATESFIAPDGQIRVSVWAADIESGMNLAEWVQAYCDSNTAPCAGIEDRAEPIVADASYPQAGVLVPFEGDIQVFFPEWYDDSAEGSIWTQPAPRGGKIFIVASWRPDGEFDSRRLLEAFSTSLCIGCGR